MTGSQVLSLIFKIFLVFRSLSPIKVNFKKTVFSLNWKLHFDSLQSPLSSLQFHSQSSHTLNALSVSSMWLHTVALLLFRVISAFHLLIGLGIKKMTRTLSIKCIFFPLISKRHNSLCQLTMSCHVNCQEGLGGSWWTKNLMSQQCAVAA